MFQDEARFGRINETKKCWSPKGTRPISKSQIVREYTYAYSAVDPKDGTMDSLILPVVSNEAMALFLEEVSRRHDNEKIIMFMDCASWHGTKNLLIPNNITLKHLPPYSPELNPVEHVWEELREKYFGNEAFNNMTAVEDRLEVGLRELENNKHVIQSIAGFPWITTALKAF